MLNEIKNFYSIEQLYNMNFSCVPKNKGIYIVKKSKEMKIEFSTDTTAIKEYRNKSMLYDIALLKDKFNKSDKEILYIGKAGGKKNKLKQRIKQYIRYGYGEVNNHRGGRAIWQIVDNKTLLLAFIECDNPEKIEKELLEEYENKYKVLPIANWKK
ncbi:GIY-YIG nuclease family protein [Clostridium saccharoperbutylacetonicum]